mmetsp:Transcript_16150/g.44993  ORF Transcript_16150/g.44993 Transcript_16150/m.44993 type:complete len:86 (-) Transcript_16150:234-491(-)
MSFAASTLRKAAAELAPKASRTFTSSRTALGSASDPHYVHAEHMYEVWNMKNRSMKFGLSISAVVLGGFGVPIVAVWYAQYKTKA